MMKVLKTLYIASSLFFLFYLCLPNQAFPQAPDDALQSDEPADTETTLRRAYFTNYTREEVMQYYERQVKKSKFLDLPLPTFRLNYPPEESQTIIRDQTRSTFLEEIVHPLRESVFVNGFEPKEEKDKIIIGGKVWRQKITVRHVPSLFLGRIFIGFSALFLIYMLSKSFYSSVSKLKEEVSEKWISR